MKKQERFFDIEKKEIKATFFGSESPVERINGNKLKINEDVCNVSDDLRNVFTDTPN